MPSAEDPRAFSVIHTQTQDGEDEDDTDYLESYSFVDGMGRARVGLAEADPDEDGGNHWIVSAIADFDAKGAVRRKYLPSFLPSAPVGFPVPDSEPQTQYGRQRYDAFGRQLQTFDVDGTVTLQSRYHALSTDLYDAADLYPGPHQGSYASTRTDGHGRTVEMTERVHDGGVLSNRYVRTQYLPTGEPTVISRVGPGTTVKRWMRYDSLGRLVLNVDPHTTANFKTDTTTQPSAAAGGMRPWIYAYNDAGDLVATSDARGCGQNFFYDGAGRLYGEDYSPCNVYHWVYTAPNVGTTPYDVSTVTAAQNAFEVFYQYDSVPAAPVAAPTTADGYPSTNDANKTLNGKLAAVHDRAATTWFVYDARGRTTQTFRKVAYSGAMNYPTFASRLVDRWYHKDFYYDAADRSVEETTGVASAELKATDGKSSVKPKYTKRGTIKSVGSSYGELVKKIVRTAEGLVTEVTLGDKANTTTHSDFDSRRRLRSVQTYRGAAPLWSSTPAGISPAPTANPPEPTLQLLLQDLDYSYDVVGNPTEIRDWRTADEWPAGAKPVTRRMEYDDLYRVTRVDYEYPGGVDAWKSPHAADMPSSNDPRRPKPIGMRTFANRPLWQTYKYDWLGNTTFTDDDQHALLDRSLGKITSNATTDSTKPRPYQFYQADSVPGATTQIYKAMAYDDAGNLTWLTSGRNTVPCTLLTDCTNLQYFYVWDEVGRLSTASKVQSGSGQTPYNPQKDSVFLYDYNDERVVKEFSEYNHLTSTRSATATTLYIFDSLEVRRAAFNNTTKQYTVDSTTEVGYLSANGMRLARLHYEPTGKGEPQLVTPDANHSSNLHIFLDLPDHLGSSSLIIDHATSELVEARTYQPYGATESDYRPERWKGFREDYGFTGKEEDVELGLIYFGKRYLNPFLGRWMSADPLAVHAPGGADLNLYAYVHGRVLRNTDPLGLYDDDGTQGQPNSANSRPSEPTPEPEPTFDPDVADAGGYGGNYSPPALSPDIKNGGEGTGTNGAVKPSTMIAEQAGAEAAGNEIGVNFLLLGGPAVVRGGAAVVRGGAAVVEAGRRAAIPRILVAFMERETAASIAPRMLSKPIAAEVSSIETILKEAGAVEDLAAVANSSGTGMGARSMCSSIAEGTTFATKQAAREALEGPLGTAANRFFRGAAKNASDFRISPLAEGGKRFEFFSAARNAGYGKLYVQEVDSTGAIMREFKETLGPNGLIQTKWVHGGP